MSSTTAPAVPPAYKAYTYEAYGAVEEQLKIREIATPPLPAHRVRIKVHSAALNPVDNKLFDAWSAAITASTPTAESPHRFGFDVAGTVVQVGPGVHATKFKVGDAVYALTSFTDRGTVAEYIEIDQQYVAHKPASLDFDQAASVPLVALTSFQALHTYTKLREGAGQRVLILGGSSSTGLYGIQFAKASGAHVTVTASAKNEPLLKSLGADVVIDYHTQKWTDVVAPHSIDIVYDCGFEPGAWNDGAQTVLKKETGEFLTLHGVPNAVPSEFGATNHGGILVYPSALDLDKITALFEAGKLQTVVDSVVPFEKALEGVARVKSRRALGKVVIKVA